MGMPGATELLIIFGVVVLLFGATKLPKLGGAVGESIRNFKKGIRGDEDEEQDPSSRIVDNSKSSVNKSQEK